MIAVAALPLAAGLSGAAFENPVKLAAGFPVAMTIAAAASLAAAVLAWTTIRDDALSQPAGETQPAAKALPPSLQRHCAVAGTPLAGPPDPQPSSRPPEADQP
jgi:dihydroorotate dehydrogenase